jgi:hypothetical protein
MANTAWNPNAAQFRESDGLQFVAEEPEVPRATSYHTYPQSPQSYLPGYVSPGLPVKAEDPPPVVETVSSRKFDVSRRLFWLIIIALVLVVAAVIGGAVGGTLAAKNSSNSKLQRYGAVEFLSFCQ